MELDKMTGILKLSQEEVPIKRVTVYLDRAEIQRQCDKQLEPGVYQFLMDGFAGSLDEGSLRLSLTGAPCRISHTSIHKTQSEAKEIRNFKKNGKILRNTEIETEADILRFSKEREVWDHYLDVLLKSNSTNFTALPSADGNVASGLADFLHSYNVERKKIEEVLMEKNKILLKTKADLAENRSWWDEFGQQTSVGVEVHIQESNLYTLAVSYTVPKALWKPSYDIFITADEQPCRMKILYKGTIQQTTGEDWNEVQLSLATVPADAPVQRLVDTNLTPARSRQFHSLSTSDRDATMKRHGSHGSLKLFNQNLIGKSTFFTDSKEELHNRVDMLPEIQYHETNHELTFGNKNICVVPILFEVPQPSSIPCNKSEVLIDCASTSIEVQLTHKCTPNLSHHVYISLNGVNNAEHLAAGPAAVYLDQKFMGKIEIPTIRRMDPFELQLGQDSEVRALVKAAQKIRDERNISNKSEFLKHTFEVTNNHDYPINLSALWDTKRNNGSTSSVLFEDALISQAHLPGEVEALQKSTLNSQKELEWLMQIPAKTSRLATLYLKADWSAASNSSVMNGQETSNTPLIPRNKTLVVEKKDGKQKQGLFGGFKQKPKENLNNKNDVTDFGETGQVFGLTD